MRDGSRLTVSLALLCGYGIAFGAVDPSEADADGTTALHWAVHRGERERVLELLAAGATVDAANRYGVRPAYLAA